MTVVRLILFYLFTGLLWLFINLPVEAGVPVKLGDEVLFQVEVGVGAFSAEERANAIASKISQLSYNRTFNPEKLKLVPNKDKIYIKSGATTIMTVTKEDAEAQNSSIEKISENNRDKINEAIRQYRKIYSLKSIIYGLFLSLLLTGLLLLLASIINKVSKRFNHYLNHHKNEIKPIKVQKLNLLSANKIYLGVSVLSRLFTIGLTFGLLYLYITAIFSFFPWTSPYALQLFSSVTRVLNDVLHAILLYFPNLIFIAIVGLVSYYVLSFLKFVFSEIEKGTLHFSWFKPDWADTTFKLLSFFTVALALAIIYPHLPGAGSDSFKGISIFLGVLVSLGSSTVVANSISGVVLTYTGAFNVGERIRIGDKTGDVIEKTLIVTRLRTIKNEIISIPNSKVLMADIVNYSLLAKEKGLLLHAEVTIGYDVPHTTVEKLLIKAAVSTVDTKEKRPPFVLIKALNDFYITYEINIPTDEPQKMAESYSKLHTNILNAFNQEGVEIMSPHYYALRDGNAAALPSENLPDNYKKAGFGVERM